MNNFSFQKKYGKCGKTEILNLSQMQEEEINWCYQLSNYKPVIKLQSFSQKTY